MMRSAACHRTMNAPIIGGGVALVWEGGARPTSIETGAVTRTLSCDTGPT